MVFAVMLVISMVTGVFTIGMIVQMFGRDPATDRELKAFSERQFLESSADSEAPVESDPTTSLSDRIRGALESSEANGTEPPRRDGTDR